MEPDSVIHIVGVHCRPDREEKFNKWYNERHIPDLIKFKGVRRVTRYKILTPDTKYPKYLAVYEFENQKVFDAFEASPERAEAAKDLNETWAAEEVELMWRVQYKVLKTWEQ